MGQVAGGTWRAGDAVVVLPSGHRSTVAAVDTVDGPIAEAIPGQSVTILLADDIDVSRGDLLADPDDAPIVAREVTARVCWMSERPVRMARVLVKHDSHHLPRIDEIVSVVDIATLDDRPSPGRMELNDLGVVRFRLAEPLAVDVYARNRATGAFVLVDEGDETVGAGMVIDERGADPYRDTTPIAGVAASMELFGVPKWASVPVAAVGIWFLVVRGTYRSVERIFLVACVFYFEVLQPRFGEGPLEDSRPPRAANVVGLVVLAAASAAYAAGVVWLGAALGLLVAALALLAAATGFCTGCEAYKLGCRLTGRPFVSCPIPGVAS
jgi:hypothetical protein